MVLTFHSPANCFGKPHLDSVLATHKEMQNFLFNFSREGSGTTVTHHLKDLIGRHFDITDVPDSFLYLPDSLGGLNLKNPFVPLLIVRNNICKEPDELMKKFHQDDKGYYEQEKKSFQAMSKHERSKRYHKYFKDDRSYEGSSEKLLSWTDAEEFPSFEEYSKWRETSSYRLQSTYKQLMSQPLKRTINVSEAIRREKQLLGFAFDMEASDGRNSLSAEEHWTIQYHEHELMEKFGGLSMVDRSLLPLGVLQAMQNRKVTWQMVL